MPLVTQSVILPKNKFTEAKATAWILKNNYTDKGKRIKNYKTTNFYRFRQRPPGNFKTGSYKTTKLSNGAELVMGVLK